ncbi:MAG: hypothetical protein FWG07_04510 [Treponema sp.]|nr:hypothetical protein [Treponema sp.]
MEFGSCCYACPLLVFGSVAIDEGALSVEINRIEVLGNQIVGETFALRFAVGM